VWLSSDQSNQANVTEYVADYARHNITVGAVDIDSLWATGVNNFVVDRSKFPDMKGFVEGMHNDSVRVILWATSMVDTDSSNYQAMVDGGFFIRDGLNDTTPSTLHWWHGDGLLLDYTNPDAVSWWNGQLDNVLDIGIDGFKTDGTDPFIAEYLLPHGDGGVVTYRDYADAYYGSFFNYSRSRNPDALIMSRPVDSYPVVDGVSAFLQFAPRYAVFSGWVGDQDPTFAGLRDAMGNMLHSAWLGYVGFGSDIGGYRSGEGALGRTGELLLRWAGVGAFCSLMENGGDKEHRPWRFDGPGSTLHVDAYRRLVAAHYEMEQYLLSAGAAAFAGNGSIMGPVMPRPADPFGILQGDNYTTFDYLLGPDVFVSPVLAAGVGSATAALPPSVAGWVSVFDKTKSFPGGANATVETPLGTVPAFRRRGALAPLHASTPHLANGDEASAGALTLLLHGPLCDGRRRPVLLAAWGAPSSEAAYACRPGRLVVDVSPLGRDVIVVVRGATARSATLSVPGGAPHCNVEAAPSAPVFGPDAAPYQAAPLPLPALREPPASPPQGDACEGVTWSSARVGPSGTPADGGVDEVVVRRAAADHGLRVELGGVSLTE